MFVPKRVSIERQRGFTLIEALLAFVILSIGLLGIVSLQAMAKTSQHLAIQHTRAVTVADAIVERIRVNPAGLVTYHTNLTPVSVANEPSPKCLSGDNCTPSQLAAHDLWAWEQTLEGADVTFYDATADEDVNAGGLISAKGCIVFTAASGRVRTGQLRVIVQWRGLQESFDAVQPGEDICGGDAAGTDDYRRQVVVNTYVVDETEF